MFQAPDEHFSKKVIGDWWGLYTQKPRNPVFSVWITKGLGILCLGNHGVSPYYDVNADVTSNNDWSVTSRIQLIITLYETAADSEAIIWRSVHRVYHFSLFDCLSHRRNVFSRSVMGQMPVVCLVKTVALDRLSPTLRFRPPLITMEACLICTRSG